MHLSSFHECFLGRCPDIPRPGLFLHGSESLKASDPLSENTLDVVHTLSREQWEFIWVVAHLAPMTPSSSIVTFPLGGSALLLTCNFPGTVNQGPAPTLTQRMANLISFASDLTPGPGSIAFLSTG